MSLVYSLNGTWASATAKKLCVNVPPGLPRETKEQREEWFAEGLREIEALRPRPTTLIFSRGIGCGMAGGKWSHYKSLIHKFAVDNPDISVLIVNKGEEMSTEIPMGGAQHSNKLSKIFKRQTTPE